MFLHLWKCGNSLLNTKLSSGMTSVSLRVGPSHKSSHIPPLIFNLHSLRHLYIINTSLSKSLFSSAHEWTDMLNRLPSTLETLFIEDCQAEKSIVNHELDSLDSDVSSRKDYYGRGRSRYIDLLALFPNLRSLSIIPLSTTKLDPSDFGGLPPTLTHFDCGEINIKQSETSILGLLPRSLIHLYGTIRYDCCPLAASMIEEDFELAPPQLEFIEKLSFYNTDVPLWCIPRTLRVGEMKFEELDFELAGSCPPLVSSFEIGFLDLASFKANSSHWLSVLPSQHMTSLYIFANLDGLFFTSSDIALLPRTLKRLRLSYSNLFYDSCFDWAGMVKLNLEDLKKLWPPSLVELDICTHSMPIKVIESLPSSMKYISISLNSCEAEAWCKSGYSCPFPTGLTKLSLTDTLVFKSLKKLLPERLESLSIFGYPWQEFGDLPQHLTTLCIEDLYEEPLTSSEDPMDPELPKFQHLPPSITHLTIMRFPLDVTPKDYEFASLKHLKHLEIRTGPNFPSSVVNHLPPNMDYLRLPGLVL